MKIRLIVALTGILVAACGPDNVYHDLPDTTPAAGQDTVETDTTPVETAECSSDEQCSDEFAFTDDICSDAGTCQHELQDGACFTKVDCPDQPHAQTFCNNNACTYVDIPCKSGEYDAFGVCKEFGCVTNEDCVDVENQRFGWCDDENTCNFDNSCTSNTDCIDVDRQLFGECGEGGMCYFPSCNNDSQCDDGVDVTDDYCDAVTASCFHVTNCYDNDPCTVDGYDQQSQQCSFMPRCEGTDYCTSDGHCVPGCRQSHDEDCDDGNPCTTDLCLDADNGSPGYCSHGDTCDDGDPDTYHTCEQVSEMEVRCKELFLGCEGPQPSYDHSCERVVCDSTTGKWAVAEKVICQTGTCENGTCVEKECESDTDCNNNPCATGECNNFRCSYVYDVCPELCNATDGRCFEDPDCGDDQDCDDGDEHTIDHCLLDGECFNAEVVTCAEGTIYEDGKCKAVVPDECQPPDRTCKYVSGVTMIMVCKVVDGSSMWVEDPSITCGSANDYFCDAVSVPPRCLPYPE